MGLAALATEAERDLFEMVLVAITNGSFPKSGSRSTLKARQRNQLRDAMIFCTHVREGRDIFVTNDVKAFDSEGGEQRFRVNTLAPQTKIMTLPDHVEIFPAHFGGAACGKGLSGKPGSTIGFERRFNPALRLTSKSEFVQFVLADLPPQPEAFADNRRRNLSGE